MPRHSQDVRLVCLCAQSPNVIARHRAAENPICPEEYILKLADDTDWYVQVGVAENSTASSELLRYLFKKKKQHAEVRRAVARHIKCPQDIMNEILKDPDWTVRQGLALNPECPTEILGKLSQDNEWEVRRMVAKHPKTSKKTLQELQKDSSECVAESAKYALKYTPQERK